MRVFTCLSVMLLVLIAASCTPKPPTIPEDISAVYSFTEQPSLDTVPEHFILGQVDGKDFIGKTMHFEPEFDQWALKIYDTTFETPDDIYVMDCREMALELPEPPAAGKTMSKTNIEIGEGGKDAYVILAPDTAPTEFEIWNADNAWVLQITDWEVGPYDPDGMNVQIAGKASGKIALCFKGNDDHKDSWIAGTFTDIPVRYNGEPPF